MGWSLFWVRRLLKSFRIFSESTGSTQPPKPVEPIESISRFIYSSAHFAATSGKVKPAAIAPVFVEKTQRFEVSVYRTDDFDSSGVWAICASNVDQPNRAMKARAICCASAYLDSALTFDEDGTPHPCHANVINWPSTKHEQKIIQVRVSQRMTLEVRSPPPAIADDPLGAV